jgi:phosphoglycolate phosphatase
MSSLEAVLFDLDGTLLDSRPEIVAGIQQAFESVGLPPPAAEAIDIGAPLLELVAILLEPHGQEHHSAIVQAFRADYTATRMYLSSPFAGIREMLERLSREPLRLYIATAKAESAAKPLLERLGLAPYFTRIYGAELNGVRTKKAELLAYLLEREGLRGEVCAMIGDRSFDMMGAVANGILPIGVAWGYGSATELRESGAAVLAESPEHLEALVHERRGVLRASA